MLSCSRGGEQGSEHSVIIQSSQKGRRGSGMQVTQKGRCVSSVIDFDKSVKQCGTCNGRANEADTAVSFFFHCLPHHRLAKVVAARQSDWISIRGGRALTAI